LGKPFVVGVVVAENESGQVCGAAVCGAKATGVWRLCNSYSLPERRMAIIHQIPITPAQL
jgi:hypothetical protein